MGVLLGTSLIFAAPAAGNEPLGQHSVQLSVLSVTPSTPTRSHTPQPLIIEIRLTNTTDQSIDKVTVTGDRGDPINSQQALEQAFAHPRPPEPELAGKFDPANGKPVTTALGPQGTSSVTYRSSTDIPQDAGLCICHNAIYPLYFTVHATDASGTDLLIGSGQTYAPAFGRSPIAPLVLVSWVWPIIDRPHRLLDDTGRSAPAERPVFTDDDLAASVAAGRLDRVLRVVETAGRLVAMTLVIDPELIDELAVMGAGPYQYQFGRKLVPGTGSGAAGKWLTRLRQALDANRALTVAFTPPADPDVESLTRNGLAWTVGLSQLAEARVSAALGGHQSSNAVAWPANGVLGLDTLTAVVRQGARAVVLSDAALPGPANQAAGPNALASLQTPAGPVLAAVTASRIQRYVAPVLSVGGTGRAELPKLVAEVAIRAVEDGASSPYVVIVAPREIDPSEVATAAILGTAHEFWSASVALGSASPPGVQPTDRGQLLPAAVDAPTLSAATLSAAKKFTRLVPALSTMLSSTDAITLLGSLPDAIQRAESSAWSTDPAAGAAYADQLNQRIDVIASGVEILKPSGGTYTLASSSSPLPLVIRNNLDVPVLVGVRVTSVNGLPGFSAAEVVRQAIPPNQRVTLHIATHVERAGRFVVQAVLYTPSGEPLGGPVFLSVHSTALGAIGVIITVCAAAVLLLALLIRFLRRLRHPEPARGTVPPLIEP
ncbi:MAG: DUF6049 family protein [Jatrophihabitantaceae bacterium]